MPTPHEVMSKWTLERVVVRGLHMSFLTMCEIGRWARQREAAFGFIDLNQHSIGVTVGDLNYRGLVHMSVLSPKECDVCGRTEQGWELTDTGEALDLESWSQQPSEEKTT